MQASCPLPGSTFNFTFKCKSTEQPERCTSKYNVESRVQDNGPIRAVKDKGRITGHVKVHLQELKSQDKGPILSLTFEVNLSESSWGSGGD